jgi:hypothetical protein
MTNRKTRMRFNNSCTLSIRCALSQTCVSGTMTRLVVGHSDRVGRQTSMFHVSNVSQGALLCLQRLGL